jgi:hypothetical protein
MQKRLIALAGPIGDFCYGSQREVAGRAAVVTNRTFVEN